MIVFLIILVILNYNWKQYKIFLVIVCGYDHHYEDQDQIIDHDIMTWSQSFDSMLIHHDNIIIIWCYFQNKVIFTCAHSKDRHCWPCPMQAWRSHSKSLQDGFPPPSASHCNLYIEIWWVIVTPLLRKSSILAPHNLPLLLRVGLDLLEIFMRIIKDRPGSFFYH